MTVSLRTSGAAPIGIVVLVAIVCVVVAVLSAAERADDVELQQERLLLTQAIADRGRRVLRELENVAASNDIVLQLHYNFDPDWVHHLVGLRLSTFFDHDHVFVVDRSRPPHLCAARQQFERRPAALRPVRAELGRIIDLLRGRAQPNRDEVVLEPSPDAMTKLEPAARRAAAANLHEPAGDRRRRRRQLPGGTARCSGAADHPGAGGEVPRRTAPVRHQRPLRPAEPAHRRRGSGAGRRTRLRSLPTAPAPPIARFAWMPNQPGGKIVSTVLPFMAIAFGGFALLTALALRYIRRTAAEARRGREPPAPSGSA